MTHVSIFSRHVGELSVCVQINVSCCVMTTTYWYCLTPYHMYFHALCNTALLDTHLHAFEVCPKFTSQCVQNPPCMYCGDFCVCARTHVSCCVMTTTYWYCLTPYRICFACIMHYYTPRHSFACIWDVPKVHRATFLLCKRVLHVFWVSIMHENVHIYILHIYILPTIFIFFKFKQYYICTQAFTWGHHVPTTYIVLTSVPPKNETCKF